MSRRFGQVPLSLWRHLAFRGLPDDARLAVMYFWCGPHSTSAGIGIVSDGYACTDLAWEMDKWLAARKAVEAAGLIARDEQTETVLVTGYLKVNRPANARHRAAIIGLIGNIECDRLREQAEEEFAQADAASTKPAQSVSRLTPEMNELARRKGLHGAG